MASKVPDNIPQEAILIGLLFGILGVLGLVLGIIANMRLDDLILH